MSTTKPALIAATDGTTRLDSTVRQAAHVAHTLGVPLHVVCCLRPLPGWEQRRMERDLPGDMRHMASPVAQAHAAMDEVRELVGQRCELHVTASELRMEAALRRLQRVVDGEIYRDEERRLELRRPALNLRVRAA